MEHEAGLPGGLVRIVLEADDLELWESAEIDTIDDRIDAVLADVRCMMREDPSEENWIVARHAVAYSLRLAAILFDRFIGAPDTIGRILKQAEWIEEMGQIADGRRAHKK